MVDIAQDPAAPFLPTLARARKEGVPLPPEHPVEERRVSALVVLASIVRRRSFTDEITAPSSMIESIEKGEPPPPTQFIEQTVMRVIDVLPGAPCKACRDTPGQRTCRICNGKGKLSSGRKCSCDEGLVPCPNCDGGTLAGRMRVRYYSDEPAWLHEVYMPSELVHEPSLFKFESTFERVIAVSQEFPELLRVHDLSDREGGSAYRGGERKKQPDFRGYDFSDTIDKALAGLGALAAGMPVVLYSIRAYAWPILWLRYTLSQPVAIYAGRDGALKVFNGTESP